MSVVTTNDNVLALGFYQRRGFGLVALRTGAVDKARRDLKPEIPELGQSGIPIHDEIELSLSLSFSQGQPGSSGAPKPVCATPIALLQAQKHRSLITEGRC